MEKQRTITQLWEMLSTSMMISETFPASDPKKFGEHVASLRAELLERFQGYIPDYDGDASRFSFYKESDVENPKMLVRSLHGVRFDSPETAREMSASYAFWAWEIEQREKEAGA